MIDPGEFFKSIPLFHDSNKKLVGMFDLGWAWETDTEQAFKCMVLGKDADGDYLVTAPSLIDWDEMECYDPTDYKRNFAVDKPVVKEKPTAPPDNTPVWVGLTQKQVDEKAHLFYSTGRLDEQGRLICYGDHLPKQFSNGRIFRASYWKVAEPNK